MPELPEVQTVVDDLAAAGLIGRRIDRARVFWPRSIAAPSVDDFSRCIAGRTVTSLGRRGKYIVIGLDPPWHLLIHLRMSGRLNLVPADVPRLAHEHVLLSLVGNDDLRLFDPRKFGRCHLLADPAEVLGRLGPEPLAAGFSARVLGERLAAHRRMLKPLLLDQRCIAGLGNIYVDEALWAARLHPCRCSDTLTRRDIAALHRAIRRVLRSGLRHMGTSLGAGAANFYSVGRRRGRNQDGLQVFRRTGLPCPRCRASIERIVVGQRSSHLCPNCQR